MNAEIIAVGTELLLGDVANIDAQIISKKLSEIGIDVFKHTVVGDNENRLKDAINLAKNRADIIITTGGLGPTYDDLTKETLAQAFGKKLVLDEKSLTKIKERFCHIGRQMTSNNEKQAYLPEDSIIFDNACGTAPGCGFYAEGCHVLMVPGPPHECEDMIKRHAIPYLKALSDHAIVSHNVHVFGMGESEMEKNLSHLMKEMKNPTIAPYAKEGECLARITAKGKTIQEAEDMIRPVLNEVLEVLGNAAYGVDAASLEELVVKELIRRRITISCAESCTGGLLAKRITDVSGASTCFAGGVVSYTNAVKEALLGVSADTIDTFGAISEQTAEAMARGIKEKLRTDIGIGITGVAGPSEQEGKPVGTVYIALCINDIVYHKKISIGRTRQSIRHMAASHALNMVRIHVLSCQ